MHMKGLTDNITDYLRAQIITGAIPPGKRLNEVELASRLEVSRSPLREAFRHLAREHLVINTPRRGTYVSPISLEDLEKTFQVREIFELYTIELLKRKKIRNLPDVEASLTRSVELKNASSDDLPTVLVHQGIVTDFHFKLIESVNNPFVTEFYRIIASHLARYQYLKFLKPGEKNHAVKDHQKILKYISAGEHDQAKEYLRKHIQYTFELLKKSVSESIHP